MSRAVLEETHWLASITPIPFHSRQRQRDCHQQDLAPGPQASGAQQETPALDSHQSWKSWEVQVLAVNQGRGRRGRM